MTKIVLADNLKYLKTLPDGYVSLIYIDPPFNTHKNQKRNMVKAILSESGLVGFGGNKYAREIVGEYGSYNDTFDNYILFIKERVEEAYRILKPNGSIYLHIDYREAHYVKIVMDEIFGRDNFINEIIWSYEWGAKSKTKWSSKHDTILFYVKDKNNYVFNYDKVPRKPYISKGLVSTEKQKIGKTVTDVWQETIVPTNSFEKQNYATQKPLRILNRIVEVSSNPEDLCMDFFAGSGSFGAACLNNNRKCILVDSSPVAFAVMKKRLKNFDFEEIDLLI